MAEKKATVLVVDDDPVVCVLLRGLLGKAGYAVIVAKNGESGVQAFQDFEPDLVLLDVMLPDINGYEVHRRITAIRPQEETSVIFISALDEETILSDCMKIESGVDYILKPIRAEILLARVANILVVVRSREELRVKNVQLKREIAERDRLAAVVQQCSESVLVVDPDGIIAYANPACEINSGFTPKELVGKSLEDIRHVKEDNSNFKEMMISIEAGEKWYGNIQNLRKNGSFFMEEISALPVWDEEGQNKGHVVMKKDVTERRRLESIASSVNLMNNVGFAFSGIRHELGNPVNSLKMTLSVLSKKIDHFSKDTILEFLERSQNEISRIEYLLKSLRSFSMFETPVPESILLREFLQNIVDMHRKDLDEANIEMRIEVAEDVETVFADSRALVQVLLNLFANAMYAVEGRMHPALSIKVKKESDSLICLSVSDNGCGISAKNQKMLFKPFYTTRAEGTGLGLVIVQKMLAEMDCSIQVESTEFEGTTFSILLPIGLEK